MQVLMNGIIVGLTIALLALAFNIVYLPTRVFHVAMGGIYAFVPYIAWTCIQYGWPWYVSIVAAIATSIALSVSCEIFNHYPLERKNASPGVHLVSSLGMYIIFAQSIVLIWGNETKVMRKGLDEVIIVCGASLTHAQMIAAVVSGVLILLVYLWLKFSNVGLQFRALADNPTEFALCGYNVHRLRLLAFGISGILSAGGALLVSNDIGFDPHGGLLAVLLAIVAVVIGGRVSLLGPVLGGILLGVIRSEVVWFFSARWQEAATFLLLVLFLFVRPQGLFGRDIRLEAKI